MLLPNINPKLADLTTAQTIQVLNTYFFWSAFFMFPAFVLLRLVAALRSRCAWSTSTAGKSDKIFGSQSAGTLSRNNSMEVS